MRNQIRSDFYHKKSEKKSFLEGMKGREKSSLLCMGELRRKDSSLDLYRKDLMHEFRKKMRESLCYSSFLCSS